jgi:hypothetical protein
MKGIAMEIAFGNFIILALAVYRASRLIIEDTVLDSFRNWVWSRFTPDRGGIGYLLTCYWCVSFWISSLVIVSYIIVPIPTIAVCAVFALSAGAGIITAWLDKK